MQLFKGRAPESDYEQLMAMLDDVFFSEDEKAQQRNFLSLIPKLYKREYNPCYNNIVIKEGDDIKAAVGLYPVEFNAAGVRLTAGGIGNVAVDKGSRGKGYMIECLNECISIMKNEDYDFSMLGGQRQRYGYFGYEPAGVTLVFDLHESNFEHILGKGAKSGFTAREITDNSDPAIAEIRALNSSLPLFALRSGAGYLDIMRTWECKLYAAYSQGSFKGYFTVSRFGGINEFMPKDNDDFLLLALCCRELTGKGTISVNVSPCNTGLAERLARACGGAHQEHSEQINVFNFASCIRAFLSVKAKTQTLCDGCFTALIHGIKRDELIEIEVQNNVVKVGEGSGEPDAELEHHEAIRFFFSAFSQARLSAPAQASQWFPLPLFSYPTDNV